MAEKLTEKLKEIISFGESVTVEFKKLKMNYQRIYLKQYVLF